MNKYQVINTYDQQMRLKSVDFYINNYVGQYPSHGMSYMETRQALQEIGEVMGLEKLIKNE